MAEDKDFKYDPEAGEDAKKTRLPFALCKKFGIEIQDWWTPRDAWNALKNGGQVEDVSEEYKEYYRKLKRKRQKDFDKNHPWRVAKKRQRAKAKKKQLDSMEHNPDKTYHHEDGKIAGVKKGKPMEFKSADSGNCNPYFGKGYIGYNTNCQTCVATYIARRKGYNVRALPNLNNLNIYQLSYNTSLAYRDSFGNHPAKKRHKDISDIALNMEAGEIYSLEFNYSGAGKGHIVIIEKEKSGRTFIYDPQNNEVINHSEFRSYQRGKYSFKTMDLTNVRIDEKFCDSIMKRR